MDKRFMLGAAALAGSAVFLLWDRDGSPDDAASANVAAGEMAGAPAEARKLPGKSSAERNPSGGHDPTQWPVTRLAGMEAVDWEEYFREESGAEQLPDDLQAELAALGEELHILLHDEGLAPDDPEVRAFVATMRHLLSPVADPARRMDELPLDPSWGNRP